MGLYQTAVCIWDLHSVEFNVIVTEPGRLEYGHRHRMVLEIAQTSNAGKRDIDACMWRRQELIAETYAHVVGYADGEACFVFRVDVGEHGRRVGGVDGIVRLVEKSIDVGVPVGHHVVDRGEVVRRQRHGRPCSA